MLLILVIGLGIALAVAWRCANNRWGWDEGQVRAHLNREPVELDRLDNDEPTFGRPDRES